MKLTEFTIRCFLMATDMRLKHGITWIRAGLSNSS